MLQVTNYDWLVTDSLTCRCAMYYEQRASKKAPLLRMMKKIRFTTTTTAVTLSKQLSVIDNLLLPLTSTSHQAGFQRLV